MILQGKHNFKAPREIVWKIMNQTESLEKSMPGCKQLIKVNEDEYEARFEMGVAAIKGKYDGKIVLSDKVAPEKMTLHMSMEGSSGIVNATAHLTLSEVGEHTLLEYQGEGQINGLIAGVGQRMLSGIAKFMLNQFFNAIEKEIR